MYILDTDFISLLEGGNPICIEYLVNIESEQIAITAVTVEERLQGWLSVIRRASGTAQSNRLIWAYVGLRQTVQYLNSFRILDWTEDAAQYFVHLRQ